MSTEVGTGYVTIMPSARGFGSNLQRQIGGDMTRAGTSAGRTYATGMQRGVASRARSVFAPLLGVGAALALGRVIKDSVILEATFSKTMAQVAVATRAPKAELEALDDLAIKLGASTVFSANESAAAMLSLAKGGLTPAQIQAGALSNTLTLAAAGELDLATAADTVVKTMGAFQLGAKDTGAAVAALAGGANSSSASVSDMTQSLAQAGTEANAAGLSVQETTGILASFADAGIQGSDAGTSLRTMLQRLVPQTDKARNLMKDLGLTFVDANGQFVSAEQIAGRLQRTFEGMSQAERTTALSTIFGSDARRAANVLINEGADGLAKYIRQTSDLDQANKLANASMKGTAGALEQLDGAVETAQLQIGKGLAPEIQKAADAASEWLEGADIEQWTRDAVSGAKSLAGELKPLATDLFEIGRDALPIFIEAGGTAIRLLEMAADVVGPLVSAFGSLPAPIQQTALAFGAAALAMPRFNAAVATSGTVMSNTRAKVSQFAASLTYPVTRMQALAGAARSAAGPAGIAALVATSQSSSQAVQTLGTAASGALLGFSAGGPIGAAIGGAAGLMLSLASNTGAASANMAKLEARAEGAAQANQNLLNTLNPLTGAFTQQTRQELALALANRSLDNSGRGLIDRFVNAGVSLRDLTGAVLGNKTATERVVDAYDEVGRSTVENRALAREYIGALRGQATEFINGAKDARSAADAAKTWGQALKGVPKNVRAVLKNEGYEVTVGQVENLTRKYNLTPKQVQTVVEALGLEGAISNSELLSSKLDALNGRTVTNEVITYYRQIGITAQQNVVDDRLNNADGNLIEAYARGGTRERHVAQMAKAGAWRLWAEPETGGESYIPHAPSKRKRALEIWAQTGRILGVAGFANGDVTGDSKGPKPLADATIRDTLAQLKETFGKQSPIVDAIQQWLEGLHRGELTQKALTARIQTAISRQIDPALRQFGVSGRQTRSETRGELNELLGTLRQTLGRDAPVVAAVERLGGHMLDVQKRQDRLVSRYDRATGELHEIIQNQRAYTNEVRAAFTHEAFEGSARDLRIQLRADANDARRATRQLRLLQRKGLSGGLFKQLAASGNTALISELSRMTPKQIRRFERDFAARARATLNLGQLAGREVFGGRRQQQAQVVARLDKRIDRLNKVLEQFEKRVGDRVENGAERGIRRGIDDRNKGQQRRRRANAGPR